MCTGVTSGKSACHVGASLHKVRSFRSLLMYGLLKYRRMQLVGSKVYLCRSSGLDLGRLDERYRSRDRDLERAIAGCLSQQCWIPYSNSRSKVERASLIRVDRRRFGTSGLGSGVTLTWSCPLWQASSHQTPRRYFAEDRASTDTGFPEVRL